MDADKLTEEVTRNKTRARLLSSRPALMGRHEFADYMEGTTGWPDMEGLIRDIYVAHADPGDSMLDVGVNHGVHFIQMAEAVGPTGRVIGLEAAPEMCRQTRATIATHYSRLADRMTLIQKAVSSAPGQAKFYFSTVNDSGLSSLAHRPELAAGEYVEISVELVTLDSALPSSFLDRLTFAKFDVEGAEFDAFKGASRVLAKRPLLTFEWDNSAPAQFNYEPHELFDLLASYGYRIFDVFGFHYSSTDEFVNARMWNFVGIPPQLSVELALKPSLNTMNSIWPGLALEVQAH